MSAWCYAGVPCLHGRVVTAVWRSRFKGCGCCVPRWGLSVLNEDEHSIQPDDGTAYTTCYDAIAAEVRPFQGQEWRTVSTSCGYCTRTGVCVSI